ncbi:MAG: hypothetical protein KH188_10485, partial [Prevotella sp.]|nr:hypothetical protein [Prevotella sp.]
MVTVKTKKQLIKAIEAGEKNIKIDSMDLYAACKLAETYDKTSDLLKHFAITNLAGMIGSVGTMNIVVTLKSATKPFNVLLACTRPLITELSDKLRLIHP